VAAQQEWVELEPCCRNACCKNSY